MRIAIGRSTVRPCAATTTSAMTAFFASFWLQAGALAAALLLLHVVGDWRDTGAPPWRWRQWREIAASILVCVAVFALITGGRGCTSGRDAGEEPVDAPDPFGRG